MLSSPTLDKVSVGRTLSCGSLGRRCGLTAGVICITVNKWSDGRLWESSNRFEKDNEGETGWREVEMKLHKGW